MAGTRSAVTSAAGSYVFLNLPAGRYTVTASLAGFKTVVRENIAVGADATTTLDLVLPVGAVKETVTVTGEPPVVDVKSATVDARIDQELLSKLPTSRDAFYDLALTTPGMSEGSGSQSLPSPTAYGSATNENVFLINGVNATNPEAGTFGTFVNVNYDAVDEVRIVGLGIEGRIRQLLRRDRRRDDQVRQQPVPRQRRDLLAARIAARWAPRPAIRAVNKDAPLPWNWLLPDLVITSTAAPEKLPYSALNPSPTDSHFFNSVVVDVHQRAERIPLRDWSR